MHGSSWRSAKTHNGSERKWLMINLKECTVLVNNKAEYIALTKEAQKQGFTWANGYALTNIFLFFPNKITL